MAQLMRTSSTPAMALLGSANEQAMLFAEAIAAVEHYNLQNNNSCNSSSNINNNTVFGDAGAATRRGGLGRTSSNGASTVSIWNSDSSNSGDNEGDTSRPPATRVTVSSPSRPSGSVGATPCTSARMRKVQSEGDLLRYNGGSSSDISGTGGAASSAANSFLSSSNNAQAATPAAGRSTGASSGTTSWPPKPRRRSLSTTEQLSPAMTAQASQGLDINNIVSITLDEAVTSSSSMAAPAAAMHAHGGAAPAYTTNVPRYVNGDVNVVDLTGGGAGGGGGGRVFHTGGGDGGGGGGSFRGADPTEAYYQKLLEQDPGHPLFLRNYAKYLAEVKHEHKKAEEYLERAILANPGDGELLGVYAQMIVDVHHDRQRAATYFERALQASPDDSYIAAAYASFLWNDEDNDDNGDEHTNHSHNNSANHPAFASPNFLISA